MKGKEKTNAFWHGLVWLGVFSALFFAVLVICVPKAEAASIVDSGTCGADGDNVKWSLNSDGVLTISGKGKMADYNNTLSPWYDYQSVIKQGMIKDGVTSIGDFAFYVCSNLSKVTIPNSVTSIGEWAFAACENLPSVTIPNSVISIGERVFYECSSLVSIWVETGSTSFFSDTSGCLYNKNKTMLIQYPIGNSGTSYAIPNGVTSIGEYSFCHCKSLTSVAIPNSVTKIGQYAFYGCSGLTSVTIPKGVASIEAYSFSDCYCLERVSIPDSVTGIGEGAFSGCSSLPDVTIPGSVVSIGKVAFVGCDSLKTVKILNSQCKIKSSAFNKTPVTIYSSEGSSAQVYAQENGLDFVVIKHTHAYEKVVVPATTTTDGSSYKQCTGCGVKGTVTTIPKVSTVKLSKTAYYYDGKAKTPTLIVQDSKGNTLKKDTDYKVAYAKGRTECGTYKVVVAFKGNYSGKVTLKFKIKLGQVTELYQQQRPGINISWTAVAGATGYEVYYSNPDTPKEFGLLMESTETSAGNSGLSKGITMNFKVRAVRILDNGTIVYGAFSDVLTATSKGNPEVASVKLSKTAYYYDGKAKTPTVIAKDDEGNTLKKDTDYKVAYAKGRTECGTYKVVVAFKGNYSGKVTLMFKIKLGKVTGLQQMDTPGINVKWNAVVGAHGYIVQYYNTSTKEWVKWGSSGDEVPKTSWGSSAQQGSRKVRVCAYRMVNGKKVTGAWSDVVQMTAN